VNRIEESEDGVRVFLADGSYEDGDIVVGCDGVASAVRQMMWDNANKLVPNSISTREMTRELRPSTHSIEITVIDIL
jgi:2-polyprenyl-6-methoxyphenol hydroxylase-like FAD-dependent oxidoreductase